MFAFDYRKQLVASASVDACLHCHMHVGLLPNSTYLHLLPFSFLNIKIDFYAYGQLPCTTADPSIHSHMQAKSTPIPENLSPLQL